MFICSRRVEKLLLVFPTYIVGMQVVFLCVPLKGQEWMCFVFLLAMVSSLQVCPRVGTPALAAVEPLVRLPPCRALRPRRTRGCSVLSLRPRSW